MQEARQFFLVHALQKVGCCFLLRPVHAHVQGAGPAERETALGLIELDRGDAEIRYASIERKSVGLFQHGTNLRKGSVDQSDAVTVGRQVLVRELEDFSISVDADDSTVGS
jgi:hypothetical protein